MPNVGIFSEQIEALKQFLMAAPPNEEQRKDTDFLLELGELFALVVYGQLICENAEIYEVSDDLVDQMFDCFVRDFSKFALNLLGKAATTDAQAELCQKMLRRPAVDNERFGRVWKETTSWRICTQ